MSKLLTLQEVAEQLRVSPRTVKREIAAGELPTVPVRGCTRILASDLDAYLQAKRKTACPFVPTVKAGRHAFEVVAMPLRELLGPGRTRSNSKGARAHASKIVELAEARLSRSKKRSLAG
jgi:excisionase family DNA binding protein